MCRCRDTGSKRCRWVHQPDSYHYNMRLSVRLDRKHVRQGLHRIMEED